MRFLKPGIGCLLFYQAAASYGKTALVETVMGRYKAIIGARLRSRRVGPH